jgi:hypothetical protein
VPPCEVPMPETEHAAPFAVGEAVRLRSVPTYLKSADPMPMLRPADLVDADEVGRVESIRAKDHLAVRFRRGAFLLTVPQLVGVSETPEQADH